MKRRRLQITVYSILFLLVAVCCLLCAESFAQNIPSTELIENAKDYNNKEITFQGEVVGDIMVRKDYAWINVYDGASALGIYCPKDMTTAIKYRGAYNIHGDAILIKGEFHKACKEHGGDLDIHATDIKTIQEGMVLEEAINKNKAILAFIFILGAFATFIVYSLIITRPDKINPKGVFRGGRFR